MFKSSAAPCPECRGAAANPSRGPTDALEQGPVKREQMQTESNQPLFESQASEAENPCARARPEQPAELRPREHCQRCLSQALICTSRVIRCAAEQWLLPSASNEHGRTAAGRDMRTINGRVGGNPSCSRGLLVPSGCFLSITPLAVVVVSRSFCAFQFATAGRDLASPLLRASCELLAVERRTIVFSVQLA
ncbi:unnamed protein product [Gongylonema pulchrum]|uniref:Transmembrane protein n=1 Tax=Gongylonema pulchrum TaxID=637853 RepID=A0A183DQW0_9BILA|nr:unnamed protein product [Gongylonema pulchrum]